MNAVKHIPMGFHAITPYLAVKDAKAAIEFYRRAFGAREIGHKWHALTHIEDVPFDEMQRRCDAMFSARK